ncbi:MAG: hypothetical protein JO053_12655 [Acidobacteria bacterium]|nr:hypothetical protein [Acidobacteriota bacterium]
MLIRVLAATVAGGLVFFLVGYILFAVLLDPILRNYMNQFPGVMKEPMPDMVMLVLWNLVTAFLFAFIFDKWAGIRTFVGGLKGGAIIMFILMLMTDLNYLAFTNLFKGYVGVVIDVIAGTVLGTLASGVIGLVLGLMNKDEKAAA